jgi:hypothetical protein
MDPFRSMLSRMSTTLMPATHHFVYPVDRQDAVHHNVIYLVVLILNNTRGYIMQIHLKGGTHQAL